MVLNLRLRAREILLLSILYDERFTINNLLVEGVVIWTIGSKLCSKKKCSLCPVESLCDKTKGIQYKNAIAHWEKR